MTNVHEKQITDMRLAIDLAQATAADCFHEDYTLNQDECNGHPAYSAFENNLTGRVLIAADGVHQYAFVEMACPKCGETDWQGDGEFLSDYDILFDEQGHYQEIVRIA